MKHILLLFKYGSFLMCHNSIQLRIHFSDNMLNITLPKARAEFELNDSQEHYFNPETFKKLKIDVNSFNHNK